jgi:hypothetical protein
MPDKNVSGLPTFWEQFNPQRPDITRTEKCLRYLVLFFAVLSLYQGLTDFSVLAYYMRELAREPLVCAGGLATFLVVPAAAWALAQRWPLGWPLAVGYLVFSLSGALVGLWAALTWHPSGAPALDQLFPRTSPLPHVLWAAVAAGGLVVLSQPAMRHVFTVGPRRIATAGLIAALLICTATALR